MASPAEEARSRQAEMARQARPLSEQTSLAAAYGFGEVDPLHGWKRSSVNSKSVPYPGKSGGEQTLMSGPIAINLQKRMVLLDDGELVPIDKFINANGECDVDEAQAATTKPDSQGRHWAVGFADFEPRRSH